MLIGEPPRTAYDVNFGLFGIPVRVHPLFWLVTLILGSNSNSKDVASVLGWIVAVFVSILCHELGHAAVMRAYGFHPWITLYGMGGLTSYDLGRSYGSKGSGALGQILITLAGPVAGFLLAILLAAGVLLAGHGCGIILMPERGWIPLVIGLPNHHLARLLDYVFFICITWGLVNLLPIYPLDGGQIAREVLQTLFKGEGIRLSLVLSTVAAVAMAAYGFLHWHNWLIAMFFGYLAYSSYLTLRAYTHRGL